MTRRLILALVALTVAAAGCTVGERPTRIPGYLFQLEPIAREVNSAIADVRAVLGPRYDSDELFVNAVVDTRLRNRLAVARDRLKRLEPTEEFAADHDRYLLMLGDLQAAAGEIDAALADPPDRAAAVNAAADLEATAKAFTELTPPTCRFASFDLALCFEAEFFTPAETAAHDALEDAAIALHSYGQIPALVRSGTEFRPYAEHAVNEIVDAVEGSRRIIESLDLLGDEGLVLAVHLSDVLRLLDVDDLSIGTPLEIALESVRVEICALAPSFPPPDPLPAEGGEVVEIDGFTEVWFAYAGRCER